jgi:hypothetical protein
MKKILATILCITTVMSFAACNKKKVETQVSGSSSQVTNETYAPVPSETTVANPASEFVKDRIEKFKVVDEDNDEEELEYHIPELQIKSAYADSVNKELSDAFAKYKKDLEKEDATHFYSTAYIPYLTKDGILSLVFISYEETDLDEYKVYNIDTKTGEKVDNARIAQAAGVSDIRKAAMDALQNWYNKMEIVKVKDYKVVPEAGQKVDEEMKGVETSFSEKYLNDKMQIGLTNEGKIFFISEVCTMAGADFYEWAYDANGGNLDDEENPYWVGWDDPEEDGDEEDDEDEPDEEDEDI